MTELISNRKIEQMIHFVRGHKVLLDSGLADLYGVTTEALNQSVRRNRERFPEDFMFRLTEQESQSLRSQIVISKKGRGGRRYLPYVFTEQGVAMLSGVLHSKRAVQINIAIMRAFVKLRQLLATHKELSIKLEELERKLEGHDEAIHNLFETIRQLLAPPTPKRRQIGFHAKE